MIIHSPKELAVVVNNQRKQKNISQSEAGSMVGLKQATVSKFETHPDTTQLATLFRILSALDLEMTIAAKQKKRWIEEW